MSAQNRDGAMAWLPFYFERFFWSTTGWSDAAIVAYLKLISRQYSEGAIHADPAILERWVPNTLKNWDLLEPKFPLCEDGMRRNPRCHDHREAAIGSRQLRCAASAKGVSARKQPLMLTNGTTNGTTNDQPIIDRDRNHRSRSKIESKIHTTPSPSVGGEGGGAIQFQVGVLERIKHREAAIPADALTSTIIGHRKFCASQCTKAKLGKSVQGLIWDAACESWAKTGIRPWDFIEKMTNNLESADFPDNVVRARLNRGATGEIDY